MRLRATILSLWLTLCACFGAMGDITSILIRPDGIGSKNGWNAQFVVDGFVAGVTSDFNYLASLDGTVTTGTFVLGETITQAGTGATAKVYSIEPNPLPNVLIRLYIETVTGIPSHTGVWTGTGLATITPRAPPCFTTPQSGANFTPYFTVTSLGFDGTGAATTRVRTVYVTKIMRFPADTVSIPGTYTTGTFVDGETITQATSGATAFVVGTQSSGALLYAKVVTGTPNNANIWTGGTSSATFTPPGSGSATTAITIGTSDVKNNGTGAIILASLSEPIFAKDDTGGGNSGVAPTFTAPAGIFVNTGGASQLSVAASAMAVTNDSQLAYPTVIGQWDRYAGVSSADRVFADFVMAFDAWSPVLPPESAGPFLEGSGGSIACVILTADGLTSMAVSAGTVTIRTQTQRTRSTLWYHAYQRTVPISGFTATESVELRAQAYPLIGDSDSVLDTDSFTTVDDEVRGKNKATIVVSPVLQVAAVDNVGGSDVGVNLYADEASAVADPYATFGEAVEDGADVVYAFAQTHVGLGSTPPSRVARTHWVTIKPRTGQSYLTTGIQVTNANNDYRCSRLRFEDLTFTLAATNGFFDGEDADNFLEFKDCRFDGSGIAQPTFSIMHLSNATYFEGCFGDLCNSEWKIDDLSSANRIAWQADGCLLYEPSANGGLGRGWFRVAGNLVIGQRGFGGPQAANPAPAHENVIFAHNWHRERGGTSIGFEYGNIEAGNLGGAFVGNSWECTVNGQPNFWVGADSSTVDVHNILIANNSGGGERWSLCYNDDDTTPRYRQNWVVSGNITECLAVKGDDFNDTNGAANGIDGRRTGGWWGNYGVNWVGNFSAQTINVNGAGAFCSEFIGLNGYQPFLAAGQPPSASTNSANTLIGWIDRRWSSGSTPGRAGGNSMLRPSAAPRWMQTNRRYRFDPYDMLGYPHGDEAGAFAVRAAIIGGSGSTVVGGAGSTIVK